MARPLAVNFASWRKSLLEDYVRRYNVPLPNQGKYMPRDYINAIRDDQIQFRNLATKDYHSLLRVPQQNNLNIQGMGYRGRILRKNLIGTIKSFISPKAFREAIFESSGDSREIIEIGSSNRDYLMTILCNFTLQTNKSKVGT